ncbi:MAG: phosphatidylserine decarboxylase family protein [Bacteroidia bacterium]
MKFHREGNTIIPVSIILITSLLIVAMYMLPTWVFALLAVAGLIFFGLILNFFRNPEVIPYVDGKSIVSPCDGKVVVIEDVQDDVYFNGPVKQISIFMSPLNVHVNRTPIAGKVEFFKYFKGKFLVAFSPKSSEVNERTYAVVSNEHMTVAFKQIAGYVARRIKWYIKEGDSVGQGEEYGFIKFGSRIDLLVPTSVNVKVNLEEKVKAGTTVIATVD